MPSPIILDASARPATADAALGVWGAPRAWDLDALQSSAVHHRNAGDGLFQLPSFSDVFAYARAVRHRKSAHPIIATLAHLLLFSQHPIVEVRGLALPYLHSLDPVSECPPAADEWRELERLAADVASVRQVQFLRRFLPDDHPKHEHDSEFEYAHHA